jgi:hypothetical protein
MFRAGALTALLLWECPMHRLAAAPGPASRASAQLEQRSLQAAGSKYSLRLAAKAERAVLNAHIGG